MKKGRNGRANHDTAYVTNILVVDDEPETRQLIADSLPSTYNLVMAPDPVEALRICQEQRFHLALVFDVALEEYEAKDTAHSSEEVVGWLAIEVGQGSWNDHDYEAVQTTEAVTSAWYAIALIMLRWCTTWPWKGMAR